MSDALLIRPYASAVMISAFDDSSTLRLALRFEAELARAQAESGILPEPTAARIADACSTLQVDARELAEEMALAGTLAIPLVRRLREHLGDDNEAAAAVHRGATSQDLADSVMILQAAQASKVLDADLRRIALALSRLARLHSTTPSMGRTLLQDARPITLGLRIAQWLAGIEDARRRLEAECERASVIQLGGAVGTQAQLGGRGVDVAARLAHSLSLRVGPPWQTRRNGVAGLASALGIVIGAIGKMARDVGLLSQDAIAELSEPQIEGRGGSSAMPHKNNPTGSQVALSAAIRAPGLVAAAMGGMPQELERGLGGWQAERPVLAELFMLAGGAAESMAMVAEGLMIDPAALSANLREAKLGEDYGEAPALVEALLAEFGVD